MILIVSSWLFDDDDDDVGDNDDDAKTIQWSFYFLRLVKSLGCYKDTGRRAVPQMDGRNPLVTGYYRKRADAIVRCGLVAKRFGYRVFALQHQGWCATGPRAHLTYRKYGRSNRCRNGKGGPWANDVYHVIGMADFTIQAVFMICISFLLFSFPCLSYQESKQNCIGLLGVICASYWLQCNVRELDWCENESSVAVTGVKLTQEVF